MKIKNIYEAKFVTKKGGYHNRMYYVSANNIPEAREKFDAYREKYTAHAFHIEIRRVKDDEILDYNTLIIC